jgi:predicted nuclease of restriction endonuclease-like (RecB) superfamily
LPIGDLRVEPIPVNRQSMIGELKESDIDAFFSIGFAHHIQIFSKCKSPEERWYYIRQCAANFWSVRVLKQHLAAGDFRHIGALPNNFALTMPDARQVSRAVQSFKDEYLLDFINIEDAADNEDVDERVLESVIVNSIKQFIQSLGPDFCFVGNQYRLIVGEEEFFIDLLFYHRLLRSMVAIELKRGKFKPAYLGQLNFYLSALDKQVKHPDENQSIGLLLCQEANRTIVELAVQDFNKPIGVATYRLGNEIPEPYRVLIPMLNGVQRIISENGNQE